MSAIKIRAALESAIVGMAGMMAIVSSSVAAATLITCALPHGLATGDLVSISEHVGSTPAIGGIYPVTVIGAAAFTIPVTVTVGGTGGGWTSTAWENTGFAPPDVGVPYQEVYLMFASPDNSEYGPNYFERGILHINLCYPLQKGTAAAAARAELLRSTFRRGAAFIKDSIVVTIMKTPTVEQGLSDGDRWRVPVKIQFQSQITV